MLKVTHLPEFPQKQPKTLTSHAIVSSLNLHEEFKYSHVNDLKFKKRDDDPMYLSK